MRKRITAALLSLVLLLMMIPVLPASAEDATEATEGAEETVYKEGDKIWIAGYGNKPEQPLQDEWLYWEMTGESRQGQCPYVEHTHSRACRDQYWNRICGFDYEHEHDPFCVIDAVEYEWVVLIDVEKLPPAENPIITIRSLGPDGEPLGGCGYILLHERFKTDANGDPIVEDGKYVMESIVLGRTTTDENTGVALLGLDDLNLDTEEETVRLLLGQELSSSLQNLYRPLLNRWYVTVVRGVNGGYTIQSVTRAPAVTIAPDAPDPEATEPEETVPDSATDPTEDLFVDEYDKQSNTLTVVNEYLRGSIKIDVQFEGFEGAVPAEVMATVTIPELADTDNGSLEFKVNENGFYLVQKSVNELLMGTYSITVSDPVQVEGYVAEEPVIQLYCPIDADPVAENTVTLDKYRQNARFVITYLYTAEEPPTVPPTQPPTTPPTEPPTTPPTEPSTVPPTEPDSTEPTKKPEGGEPVTPNVSNTVVVRAIDDQELPLPGTEVALYDGKNQLHKWRETYENVFVLDDLEKFAKKDETVTFTLKQTRAPSGYRLSGDSYTVKISNKNGITEVDVKKNVGAMQNLFKGNGIEIGSDGKQIVTFRNTRKTAKIELVCQVAVNFDEESWFDEELIAEYKLRQYEFTLNWENAKGEAQVETVLLADGESVLLEAELPYGTDYEVTVTNTDGSYLTEYSDNHTGKVEASQLKENILISAIQQYTVELGDAVALDLVKVDAEDKRPLAGVRFSLKNEKGMELKTYTSGESGELIIRDVISKPGTYLLEEIQTLEGYVLMTEPVKIDVTAAYVLDTSRGMPVMVQNLSAEIAHSAVVAESDGSFWVENERAAVTAAPEESDGLGLGAIIGIGAAVAAVAAAAVFFLIRRKRTRG